MRRKPFLLLMIGLALAASAQAQWKWKDAKGNVQYSDRPPPVGTPDKDILLRPPSASRIVGVVPAGQSASAASAPAPRPVASAPNPDAARQKQEQERDAAKQKEEERRVAEQRRENCARAQGNLRDLQSGIRITRTNEQGERIFMDDVQRQAEVERARQLITSECR